MYKLILHTDIPKFVKLYVPTTFYTRVVEMCMYCEFVGLMQVCNLFPFQKTNMCVNDRKCYRYRCGIAALT